jgi:hypothetical protein
MTTTYETISLTQANDSERSLYAFVSKASQEIASYKISNQLTRHGYEAELAVAQKANLDGVRLDFVNTQMELSHLHAELDHAQSDWSRMTDQAKNVIFGAILGFAEVEA